MADVPIGEGGAGWLSRDGEKKNMIDLIDTQVPRLPVSRCSLVRSGLTDFWSCTRDTGTRGKRCAEVNQKFFPPPRSCSSVVLSLLPVRLSYRLPRCYGHRFLRIVTVLPIIAIFSIPSQRWFHNANRGTNALVT